MTGSRGRNRVPVDDHLSRDALRGVRGDGGIFCWGGNFYGQLATGTAWRTEPTPVLNP